MSVLQINPALASCLREAGVHSFDDFYHRAGGEVVSGHLSRNVARVDLGGLRCFLKREFRVGLKDYLGSWWGGFGPVSKSRREWRALHALRAHGIRCPEPVAVGEERERAFLLVREIPGAVDLHTYLRSGEFAGDEHRHALARRLGRAVARFHAAGFTHPDLYAKHIFYQPEDETVWFIDFQRTHWRRAVYWNERWRDLAALHASLNDTLVSGGERWHFFATYLREAGIRSSSGRVEQAVATISRRTAHLLGRRKVQTMRRPMGAADRLEVYRVTMTDDGPQIDGSTPLETAAETRGRW